MKRNESFFERNKYELIKYITIFLLFVIPIAMTSKMYNNFDDVKFFILRFLLVIMIIITCLYYYTPENLGKLKNPLTLSITCYVLLYVISTVFSQNWIVSKDKLFDLITYVMAYFVWVMAIRKEDEKGYILAICFSGFVVSIYSLLQHCGIDFSGINNASNPIVVVKRSVSTIGNPVYLALYQVMFLPLLYYLLITNEKIFSNVSTKGNTSHYQIMNRIIIILLLLVCQFSMILTYTRGAWFANIASCIFIFTAIPKQFIESNKKHIRYFVILIIFLVVLFLAFTYLKKSQFDMNDRIIPKIQGRYGLINDNRPYLWKAAIQIAINKPLFGNGPGTFPYEYLKYRKDENQKMRKSNEYMTQCHNQLLETASTAGTFTLVAYIAIIFLTFIYGYNIIKCYSKERKIKWICYISCFLAYWVQTFFNYPTIPSEMLWWFLLSLLTVEYASIRNFKELSVSERNKKINKNYIILSLIVIYIITAIIFVFNMTNAIGSHSLATARENSFAKKYEAAEKLYSQAIFFMPFFEVCYISRAMMYESMIYEGKENNDLKNKVINDYLKAIGLNSRNPYTYNNLGRFYENLAKGDNSSFLKSEEYYKKASETDPFNFQFYDNLGTLCFSYGRLDDALAFFVKESEICPNEKAFYNIAVIKYKQNEINKALDYVNEAIKLNRDYDKAQKLKEIIENSLTK